VSAAFVIAVSISAALVLTAALWVVIDDGTAVPASAFLTIYQSVSCNIPAACAFKVLINTVFSPSTFTSPTSLSSGKSPSSESCCVHKVSACALAVAVPHDLVTLPLLNVYDSLVLIYHFSSL
jgi:hypothetical protein